MELEVLTPISAEAEVKKYTLVGDDIYVKRYTNENIPEWYRNLISDIVANDATITDINAAIDYLNTLPAGYNQMITELRNAELTINTSLESLVATTGDHTAAIANLDVTKVDATSAQAIARDTVGAYFADGRAGAWFNNQISTYASDISANAMNISTLSATLNGQTVRIGTVEEVAVSAAVVIRSSVSPTTTTHPALKPGDYWVDTANGNIEYVWNGVTWEETTTGSAEQAVVWSANASKLITAPDGSVTGWSFGDGSNTQSNFKIKAQNFSVSDGVTGYTPFSISGGNIYFNGKVEFTNVSNTPVINKTFVQTTAPTKGMVAGDTWVDSDGGYAVYTYSGSSWVAGGAKTYSQASAPTSGILTGDIWIDTDDNNKLYRYNGTTWVNQTMTSGGIISAINGTTNTTTIDGGKITTGSIWVGGNVKSSNYSWNNGTPIGFGLFSNGDDNSGRRYTMIGGSIYGAYLKGGIIEGTSIRNSSGTFTVSPDGVIKGAVIKAPNFVYINKYGKELTRLSYYESGTISAVYKAYDDLTCISEHEVTAGHMYYPGIYGQNDINSSTNRLGDYNEITVTFTISGVYPGYRGMYIQIGARVVLLDSYNNKISCTMVSLSNYSEGELGNTIVPSQTHSVIFTVYDLVSGPVKIGIYASHTDHGGDSFWNSISTSIKVLRKSEMLQ